MHMASDVSLWHHHILRLQKQHIQFQKHQKIYPALYLSAYSKYSVFSFWVQLLKSSPKMSIVLCYPHLHFILYLHPHSLSCVSTPTVFGYNHNVFYISSTVICIYIHSFVSLNPHCLAYLNPTQSCLPTSCLIVYIQTVLCFYIHKVKHHMVLSVYINTVLKWECVNNVPLFQS